MAKVRTLKHSDLCHCMQEEAKREAGQHWTVQDGRLAIQALRNNR